MRIASGLSVGPSLGRQGIREGRSFVKNTPKIAPCFQIRKIGNVSESKIETTAQGAVSGIFFLTVNPTSTC